MATPMTASQIKSQLNKWDIKYEGYKDWSTHNRNHKGDWGPVNGFMVHHTGSDSTDQRSLLYNGTSSLPGPLCQFGIDQKGKVHLVGWGRANHAGSGDPDVLNAVINEDYGDNPPTDNESSVDGNARFYGVEIWYSGSHKMSDAQYATLRKLAAAVCDFHGWSEKSVIAHAEWGSPGKWDPGYASGKTYDMSNMRADIKTTLKGTTSTATTNTNTNTNTNTTTDEEEDDMATASEIASAVWGKDLTHDGTTMAASTYVKRTWDNTSKVEPSFEDVVASLAELKTLVEALQTTVDGLSS